MNGVMGSTLGGFILIGLAALVVAAALGTTIDTPERAIVYLNDGEQTFYAEPCVTEDFDVRERAALRVATYREVGLGDYTPSPDCTVALTQKGRSLLGVFLEKLFILSPLPSRWDEDGHWAY